MSDSRAAFNEHAESYDQYALVQRDLVEWMGALVRDELRGGCCLEYGAGTGLLTRLLVESFEEVLASDVSEEMVRVGKGHVPEAVWEVRDAWASRQSGESFDCVASASLLQWAVEPVVVLRRWRESLKPGGHLLAGFFLEGSLAELAELKGEGVFPFEWRSIEEWKGFFEEAGWELQEMKTKEMVYHFSTVREVFQQWHGIGSVSQTESKLALSVMRELMHDYKQQFSSPEGVQVSWKAAVVSAR